MAFHGPVINTDLTITPAKEEALRQAGQPIPAPVRCRFLIDTGADGTIVKHEFAERAGLKLISDNLPLHGVGVDTSGRAYIGRIMFATPSKIADAMHQMYVDTQIMSGNLESELIDGLSFGACAEKRPSRPAIDACLSPRRVSNQKPRRKPLWKL